MSDSDILAAKHNKLALFQLTTLLDTLSITEQRRRKSLTLCACTSFPSFFADARKGVSAANTCSTIHTRVWNTTAVFSFENRKGIYLAQQIYTSSGCIKITNLNSTYVSIARLTRRWKDSKKSHMHSHLSPTFTITNQMLNWIKINYLFFPPCKVSIPQTLLNSYSGSIPHQLGYTACTGCEHWLVLMTRHFSRKGKKLPWTQSRSNWKGIDSQLEYSFPHLLND